MTLLLRTFELDASNHAYALEGLLEMRFCPRMRAPPHARLVPRQSNGAYASRV